MWSTSTIRSLPS